MPTLDRKLRVFLCHSSLDKSIVRELYQRLLAESWIDPWLDEEKLLPGQDWDMEIEKAVETTDAVIVCLSLNSVNKEGYIQKEIRKVLDISDKKLEDAIFVIPLRLEECEPPRRLAKWQYVDYFPIPIREKTIQVLIKALRLRATSVAMQDDANSIHKKKYTIYSWGKMDFVKIPKGKFLIGSLSDNYLAYGDELPQHEFDISYDYWIARFPVTNQQFAEYVDDQKIKHPVENWEELVDYPIYKISWDIAIKYCRWLNSRLSSQLPQGTILRLPTEAEWEKAARGTSGLEWPWGDTFDPTKCNVSQGASLYDRQHQTGISIETVGDKITSVFTHTPQGDSPYGCADMVGNIWEWTNSLFKPYPYNAMDGRENSYIRGQRVVRGGSFAYNFRVARCAFRYNGPISIWTDACGFRVCVAPPLS